MPRGLVKRTPSASQLITVKEASEMLGCSPTSITTRGIGCFSLVRLGDKVNSPLRLIKAEVEDFINQRIALAQHERARILGDIETKRRK